MQPLTSSGCNVLRQEGRGLPCWCQPHRPPRPGAALPAPADASRARATGKRKAAEDQRRSKLSPEFDALLQTLVVSGLLACVPDDLVTAGRQYGSGVCVECARAPGPDGHQQQCTVLARLLPRRCMHAAVRRLECLEPCN